MSKHALSYFDISKECKELAFLLNVPQPNVQQLALIFQTFGHCAPSVFIKAVKNLSLREFFKFPGSGFFETEINKVKCECKSENKFSLKEIPESERATQADWDKLKSKLNKLGNKYKTNCQIKSSL